MTIQLPIAEAAAQFADLLVRVEAGEEVLITRDGAPVARLSPARAGLAGDPSAKGVRRLGVLAHLGTVVEADPRVWDEDVEAADYLEQGFAGDRLR